MTELKKGTGFLLILCVLIACNQQERPVVAEEGPVIVFEDYFPLKNGKGEEFYISHITEKDTLVKENDSSICKSAFVKDREIFYFDNAMKSSDTTIIGSSVFCDGVFYFDRGNFWFSPVFWKYELKKANPGYFEVLFPRSLKLGSVYKYKNGEEVRKYKFTGFETIKAKGKEFSECLKLTVTQDWITAQYTDTVWFRKGRGVVKWHRGTGRLEEIK
ncbi:MAG: hypothetical protein JWO44_669 [Bacteroidetes bacterium]|nr:hypothetical protein [Bacteroidota bacterium]